MFSYDQVLNQLKVAANSTENSETGVYFINVTEIDLITGYKFTHQIQLTVKEPTIEIGTAAISETDKLSEEYFEAILLSQNRKVDNPNAVPLKAKVYDFTPTGNLTITFNKPIIIPPVEVESEEETRRLTATAFQKYSIQDVMQLSVESSYHDQDDQEISIKDYRLTRLTSRQMDIQIDFNYPKKLTPNDVDPDSLTINFKEEVLFIDSTDFTLLE